MLTAIIVAGGSSQRMGFDKLFVTLNGQPVVAHALAAFEETASVAEIVLVGRAERLAELQALVQARGFGKVSAVVPGGERRQDSVQRGLEVVRPEIEYLAVHDAARPLVRPRLVERIYQAARTHGGAASASPVSDTLKRVDDQRVVTGGVARENLFAVETPQIFQRALLEKACLSVAAAGVEVTDEISAVERVGGRVVLVPNDESNFKITYPADLALAEFVLRQRAGGS